MYMCVCVWGGGGVGVDIVLLYSMIGDTLLSDKQFIFSISYY